MNQQVDLCYQCAKCSAGCPIGDAMDYLPHQILKMLQLNLTNEVLKSSTIWLCAGCLTCVTRCPMDIDMPQIMDTLRAQAIKQHLAAREKRIAAFYDSFLIDVAKRGRVHELSQLLAYKLASKDLFSDIGLGIKMLTGGQLNLKPNKIEHVDHVRDIFEAFGSGD